MATKRKRSIFLLLSKIPVFHRLFLLLDRIFLPGFRGCSFLSVFRFFIRGVRNPEFNLYAGGLSFNFFLALFPTILFIFTIIAYIPIEGIHRSILDYLELVLPDNAFLTMESTIKDILKNQNGGLLSFGIIAALYFASNGFFNMMLAFDSSLDEESKKRRNFFSKRMLSIYLTLLVTLLVIAALLLLLIVSYVTKQMYKIDFIADIIVQYGSYTSQFVILGSLVFLIYSFMYFYGPSNKKRWQFISPGAIVATSLSVLSTFVFSYYVNNFNAYNKIYGSIGAIIVLMLLVYINSLSILIGFELNRSIDTVEKTILLNKKPENKFL